MNRIIERRNYFQPKHSLSAEGSGKVACKTSTTTSTACVVGLNPLALANKNLQKEMTLEMKTQKLPPGKSLLPELTRGLSPTGILNAKNDSCNDAGASLSAPSPHTFNDGSPSRQHATNRSNLKTCLHFNEGTKTPKQCISKKKAVGFETTVRVRDIPRKTDEQIQKVWYSHEEQDQFVLQAQKVVKLSRRSNLAEDDFEDEHQESTLGLDHFLNKALFKKLNREKNDVIEAVIILQEEMSASGRPIDHDLLAFACSSLSSPARERAHLVGLGHSQLFAMC